MTGATTGARAREGRQTREAIIAAAKRLIQIQGYNATSLDDVLRESGVGKGSFYHHFKSKEDLGYAILDEIVDSFLARTLEPCFADPDGHPLSQIRCFLDRVLESQREAGCVGGCPLGNLASELSDVHEGFRARLAGIFAAWRQRLTRALEEARRRGLVIPECRADVVAGFLVASLEGAILLGKVSKDVTLLDTCVAELERHLALYEQRP
jgi:TetR/AcrR family transcriptional repressor of nem operon